MLAEIHMEEKNYDLASDHVRRYIQLCIEKYGKNHWRVAKPLILAAKIFSLSGNIQ
jgi:hypothetical protein